MAVAVDAFIGDGGSLGLVSVGGGGWVVAVRLSVVGVGCG